MRRVTLWKEILIASASVVLGIMIGPVLEQVTASSFSTEVRANLTTTAVLGLLIVIGVTIVGIFIRHNEDISISLEHELQSLRRRLGLHGEFILDLPRKDATGEVYRRSAEIIERAEKSIWILWYQRPPQQHKSEAEMRSEPWMQQRDRYHDLIMHKCQEHARDSFFYRRILQIPQFRDVKDGHIQRSMISATMVRHCRDLLTFIQQHPETAVLKYAPVLLRHVFVLVDERYILWEIDATDPETEVGYMDSLIIFDDVDGDFARYLKNFFLKVDTYALMARQIID